MKFNNIEEMEKMRKFKDYLRIRRACKTGTAYVNRQKSPQACWDNCKDFMWMTWFCRWTMCNSMKFHNALQDIRAQLILGLEDAPICPTCFKITSENSNYNESLDIDIEDLMYMSHNCDPSKPRGEYKSWSKSNKILYYNAINTAACDILRGYFPEIPWNSDYLQVRP